MLTSWISKIDAMLDSVSIRYVKSALPCTYNMWVSNLGTARHKNNLLGLALLDHLHDFARGRAADNTVVNKAHNLVLELRGNGRQLSADTLFAGFLTGKLYTLLAFLP